MHCESILLYEQSLCMHCGRMPLGKKSLSSRQGPMLLDKGK